MKHAIAFTIWTAVVAAAGAASLAAPQVRPGEPTKPSVWVENRGQNEAIPTTIEGMSDFVKPLRVEVTGTTAVALAPSTMIQVRQARQSWEHRLITVPAGGDLEAGLAKLEADNWEAVGFQATAQGATTVLLKRPR